MAISNDLALECYNIVKKTGFGAVDGNVANGEIERVKIVFTLKTDEQVKELIEIFNN